MKAAALKRYLGNPREVIHARMISASRSGEAEILEVDVDVALPQRPIKDIRKIERIRIKLPDSDHLPVVYALRKAFPILPHTMANGGSYPRQLCLYERPWTEERTNWSPRSFMERIRRWFAGTADGTLHPDDQPLELVLADNSPFRIALPYLPRVPGKLCRVERLYFSRPLEKFWVARRTPPSGLPTGVLPLPVLVVEGPTSHHGLMHSLPTTLSELEVLFAGLGKSLVATIAGELASLRAELLAQPDFPLLLVVELPKTRHPGGRVETIEYRAFFVGERSGELFSTETKFEKVEGLYLPKKKENFTDPERLKKTILIPLSVRWHLTPDSAAKMNGHQPFRRKVLAIGAGALGSQLTSNLYRGGFGIWTVVDDDQLESHNPARHRATSVDVGQPKAPWLARDLAALFPEEPAPIALDLNYLAPGNQVDLLAKALGEADLIVDFSASVTVERKLATDARTTARRASAFLNQRGDESVLLFEDAGRSQDLFWLESLYYRAVAYDPELRGHFDDVGSVAHRYGNGCREVSTVVPQDGIALHAGLLAHAIRKCALAPDAVITVSRWARTTGAVKVVQVPAVPPCVIVTGGWRVLIHPEVVYTMLELRRQNLPRETGGVMLGIVDRTSRSLAIVGVLPAPPDSHAWPTSFLRGSNGLSAEVGRFNKRSLGNIIYAGEWHSHPDGCDATPSLLDVQAVELCSDNMRADELPTFMMIVAAADVSVVLQPPDDNHLYVTKVPQSLLQP